MDGLAQLNASFIRLAEAFLTLMETSAPIGPAIVLFAPAVVCLILLRVGYAVLAAGLAAASFMTAGIAGSGLAFGVLYGLSWLMVLFAASASRNARQFRALRDEIADLRTELNAPKAG